MHNDALESAIRELNLTGEEHWAQLLSSTLDEQPHLMSFLINLSDDFSEPVHDHLIRAAVLLTNAFKKTDVSIDLITPTSLDEIITEKVAAYEQLDQNEELDSTSMEKLANSPLVFDRIRSWFGSQLGEEMPILDESQANINLLIDVIISAMEMNAIQPGDDSKTTENA